MQPMVEPPRVLDRDEAAAGDAEALVEVRPIRIESPRGKVSEDRLESLTIIGEPGGTGRRNGAESRVAWMRKANNCDSRRSVNAGADPRAACFVARDAFLQWTDRAVALLASMAILGCSASCRRVEPPVQESFRTRNAAIRLMTGTPGGGFYPVGTEVTAAFARRNPALVLDHRESAGSISNVTALDRDEADLALAYADVAYLAYSGSLEGNTKRFDRLRGVAVLQLAPVHLVVARASGIRDVAGLRGRRVAVGTMGSGTALTAGLILRAYGVDPSSIETQMLRYDEAAARLSTGGLDAMFVIGNDPVDAVRTALAAGGTLIPLTGPAIDRLRHEYPFFRLAVVRRGAYDGQSEAVRTVGVESLLLCRDKLSEALVYDLTSSLFEVQPAVAALREMDLDHAPAVPIPLHDGAARFYREREILR